MLLGPVSSWSCRWRFSDCRDQTALNLPGRFLCSHSGGAQTSTPSNRAMSTSLTTCEWKKVFYEKMEVAKPSDSWELIIDPNLKPNELAPGWKQYLEQHASGRWEVWGGRPCRQPLEHSPGHLPRGGRETCGAPSWCQLRVKGREDPARWIEKALILISAVPPTHWVTPESCVLSLGLDLPW